MVYKIALFGESQKGDFRKAYFCQTLIQLSEYLGEPASPESKGVPFAVQALLYEYGVIFFRVHEEGFSLPDYMKGLAYLEKTQSISDLTAICLPGVGNNEILEATTPICAAHHSFLIISEKDLYDYLTDRQ